jgi:hypothetical protein
MNLGNAFAEVGGNEGKTSATAKWTAVGAIQISVNYESGMGQEKIWDWIK